MRKIDLYLLQKKLLPGTITSAKMIKYLRNNKGIEIGKGTIIYDAGTVTIDYTRPCLLTIGEYCKITAGVKILTHDYSRSVLRRVYGTIIGEAKKTIIGNNVFIGVNSIILMGAKIGNNVIIGAGSVVNGTIPDNVVAAGNPAKVICSLDEYYQKRCKAYVEEAFDYFSYFKMKYGRYPTIHDMDPFFPLFLNRDIKELDKYNLTVKLGGDEHSDVLDSFLNSQPMFDGFDAFIKEWERRNDV